MNQEKPMPIPVDLQMQGRVSSIQTMGTVDGPGLRFVVFLQGCHLRCIYCHNPETWEIEAGDLTTVEALLKKILRYRHYFGKEGGLTVSGGEPLLQGAFLYHLLAACKEEGIHTIIDTSGSVRTPWAKRCLEVADMVLLDMKFTEEQAYQDYVGCGLQPVLATLAQLEALQKDVWLRQVIVQGYHDNPENIGRLRALQQQYHCVKKIELLPFRKLCLEKYENMGRIFPLQETPETPQELIDKLLKELR